MGHSADRSASAADHAATWAAWWAVCSPWRIPWTIWRATWATWRTPRPTARTIWRAAWSAWRTACPGRQAPLSPGGHLGHLADNSDHLDLLRDHLEHLSGLGHLAGHFCHLADPEVHLEDPSGPCARAARLPNLMSLLAPHLGLQWRAPSAAARGRGALACPDGVREFRSRRRPRAVDTAGSWGGKCTLGAPHSGLQRTGEARKGRARVPWP